MLSIPVRFALRWICLTGFCWFMGTKGSMLIAWALYGVALFLEAGIEPKLPERPKDFGVWPAVGVTVIMLLFFAAGYWELVPAEIYEVVFYPLAVVFLYGLCVTVDMWRYQEYQKTLTAQLDSSTSDA